jgi:tRNA dimethylallyltransferase
VLVGATAVGKTAVALALGRRWPVTVISADSRQVYRGLDVGTAKPTPEERQLVPHHGIDLVEPGERYSAGRFAREAAGWLVGLDADRRPLVVGGTGLYVRALADGLFREPPMDGGRRERLRTWAGTARGLGRWATRLDPGFRAGGRQRAARVVEVALLTGRPLSWWQRTARQEGVMRPWYLLLTVPRQVLHRRIACRVDRMLRDGLVEEVERVLARGVPPRAPGLDAVGYREVVRHLEGRLPGAALGEAITAATRRYARRQETWFRHQLVGRPVITLDATAPPEWLADRIVQLWGERGR